MAGKKFGLIIGNNYPNSNRELKFAVEDATKMKEILKNKDICGFDKVVDLIDRTSREALIEVEKIFRKAENDLVFIYFSGYGKQDFERNLCFLFKDTEEDTLLSTSLTFDFIHKCSRYPPRKSVIIVLDCCYNGSGIDGARNADVMEAIKAHSGLGTVIITSTGLTGFPIEKENEKLGHGIFTYHLIEGLETGNADENGDGLIFINDLYNYALKKMIEYSDQSPKIEGKIEGNILIGMNHLKIKAKEYELKQKRFLEEFRDKLPSRILDKSLTTLRSPYNSTPSSENKLINSYIESLLNGEFSIKSYIEAVEFQISKNASTSKNSSIVNKMKLEIPGLENTQFNEIPENLDIRKNLVSSSTNMEFVRISPGKFMMGSPLNKKGRYRDEVPSHEVTIDYPFYLGKYPVTQIQWKKVMSGNNPSKFRGEYRPVESVSWYDVQDFIKKLNEMEQTDKYRLPSEAEWEYACRAGTKTKYSFGDDCSRLEEYGWFSGYFTFEEWNKNLGTIMSKGYTYYVGQKKPNPWGLYDMHGNVWEWVQDREHTNYIDAPSDGSAWEDEYDSRRIIRGGCCGLDAESCTSTCRNGVQPESISNTLGFRLLKEYSS